MLITMDQPIYLVMKDPSDDKGLKEWHFEFKPIKRSKKDGATTLTYYLSIPTYGRHHPTAVSPEQDTFVKSYFKSHDPTKEHVKPHWYGSWCSQDNASFIAFFEHLIQEHGAVETTKGAASAHIHPGGHKEYMSFFDGGFRGW